MNDTLQTVYAVYTLSIQTTSRGGGQQKSDHTCLHQYLSENHSCTGHIESGGTRIEVHQTLLRGCHKTDFATCK